MKLSIRIITNLISRIWITGIGIVLVPQYIKFIGIESYGLVGFYGTLLGTMSLLDLGLSTSLNRELTKATVQNKPADETRNMVFTIECIYWLIGVSIALLVIILAPIIADHWIKSEHLPKETVKQAVMLMGVIIAFQWPISLYNGGLSGLERQVTDNVIMVLMTTLRSAGVILLLWLVSPTIKIFFLWQAVSSFLYVVTMRVSLWHYLPKSIKWPKFSKIELVKIWRFAAGMTGISLVTFFLSQIDKVVLSKILPLSQFAYYMLAFTVASSITMFVAPINITFFPRLTAMVSANDQEGLKGTYHKACRLVASVVFPVGLVLIVFAREILLIWTKNPVTVNNTALMVQVLVAGSVLNCLMVIPYLLMLANGQTRYTFYQNIIASIILVPMLFLWVHLYGAVGGTFVWLSVNTAYIVISIPLIHNKFLKGELATWYIKDNFLILLPSMLSIILIKLLVYKLQNHIILNLFALMVISIFVLTSSLLFLPESKGWIRKQLHTK